ncbi:Hypothetical protein RAK1035_3448 [Roseovarius sp. AK1035]|nr:Hypothetical protein RAK1035_3448 [Roseovarius sp. AK1035]
MVFFWFSRCNPIVMVFADECFGANQFPCHHNSWVRPTWNIHTD